MAVCEISKPQKQKMPASCLGCGGESPLEEMLRFVVGPDGQVYLDVAQRLPGVGGYVHPERACLLKGIASGALASFLTGRITQTPADFIQEVLQHLRNRFFSLLGLQRKSGTLLLGADKVLEGMNNGKVAGVFYATDAAFNTQQKLVQKGKHTKIVTVAVGDKSVYAVSFQKPNNTVVGVLKGGGLGKICRLARAINALTL